MKYFLTAAIAAALLGATPALAQTAREYRDGIGYLDFREYAQLCDGQSTNEGLICVLESSPTTNRAAIMAPQVEAQTIYIIALMEVRSEEALLGHEIRIDSAHSERDSTEPVARALVREDGSIAFDPDYGSGGLEAATAAVEEYQDEIRLLYSALTETP
jgi:hypothetical protein